MSFILGGGIAKIFLSPSSYYLYIVIFGIFVSRTLSPTPLYYTGTMYSSVVCFKIFY